MLRRAAWRLQEVPAAPTWCDVVISGGGLVGATMMASLQQLRQRLPLCDKTAPEAPRRVGCSQGAAAPLSRLCLVESTRRPRYDATRAMDRLRTVNITPVSSKILDNLGVWQRLGTKHPFYRMSIRHEQVNSPDLSVAERSNTFFMSRLLGKKSTAAPLLEFTDLQTPLGFICYNAELNSATVDVVEAQSAETDAMHFESVLDDVELPPAGVVDGPWGSARIAARDMAAAATGERVLQEAAGDAPVRFSLLLGCEGRGSPLRHKLATPAYQHDYGQTAYVCNVRLEKVDDGNVCAFQNFFRDGMIVGMLPTSEDTANIVFTTTPQHAQMLMSATSDEVVQDLNARLCRYAPEDIPRIVSVAERDAGQRVQGTFPLHLCVATRPCAARAILLGDAAHGIHPFAGQGLNLGLYDVCALTNVLSRALAAGQDVGSSVAVGQVFAGEMLAHTAPVITGMEVTKELLYLVPGLSSWGMGVLNRLPLLSTVCKDAIVQVASGSSFAARHRDCFLLR